MVGNLIAGTAQDNGWAGLVLHSAVAGEQVRGAEIAGLEHERHLKVTPPKVTGTPMAPAASLAFLRGMVPSALIPRPVVGRSAAIDRISQSHRDEPRSATGADQAPRSSGRRLSTCVIPITS
nr:hypothetical protein [Streptomyces sp. 2131.1]